MASYLKFGGSGSAFISVSLLVTFGVNVQLQAIMENLPIRMRQALALAVKKSLFSQVLNFPNLSLLSSLLIAFV